MVDWLGWPRGDVYKYAQSALDALTSLYAKGENQKLKEKWGTLEPLNDLVKKN